MAVAGDLDRRGRTVGHVAVHGAIAVVHGADKRSRAPLLSPCGRPWCCGMRCCCPAAPAEPEPFCWKNFFFFRCRPDPALAARLLLGMRLLRRRSLHLAAAPAGAASAGVAPAVPAARVLLVRFVLAAAPAAPMPLRLPLAVGRGWPQFWLGRVDSVVMRVLPGTLLCGALRLLGFSIFFSEGAELPFPCRSSDWTRNTLSVAFACRRCRALCRGSEL